MDSLFSVNPNKTDHDPIVHQSIGDPFQTDGTQMGDVGVLSISLRSDILITTGMGGVSEGSE